MNSFPGLKREAIVGAGGCVVLVLSPVRQSAAGRAYFM
jgi:hypothetical protein